MTRLFTYGMLIDDAEAPARLDGYRLAFMDGLATIEPAPGEHVSGGLIALNEWSRRNIGYYDSIEGVKKGDPSSTRGHYRRVPVTVDGGEQVWVYIRNAGPCGQHPAPPNVGYLAMIHAGYIKLGLPEDELEAAVTRAREARP